MRATFRTVFLTAVGAVALSVSAVAQSAFDRGMASHERGDYSTAVQFFRPLAEQGNAAAQYNLGLMYANGEGVPQNDAEAAKWYRLAAVQGNAPAQYNLGVMYRTGEGVPQDGAEAVKWYRLAADQGDVAAQINLGLMYQKGEGAPENYVEAYKWYSLAAAQGQSAVRNNRDAVRRLMTPAQVAEAQKLAAEWKPTK